MKIVTQNIRHGGGTRAMLITQSVLSHAADVIVLTEYRENKNAGYFHSCLQDAGYLYRASSSLIPKLNGVFVASKIPFVSTRFEQELGENSQRVLGIEFADFRVLAVYFPLREKKRKVFEFLLESGLAYLGENGLLIGDYNTGKHFQDEKGKTFYCAEYLDQLENRGMVDSWRSRNRDTKEYSWLSHAGNGFRIDHAFSTGAQDKLVKSVNYSHVEREQKVSDHSALMVTYCNP